MMAAGIGHSSPISQLSQEEIARRLTAFKRGKPPSHSGGGLSPAAVLVPLLWWEAQWHLLFTRRTDTVQTHKGQVSFPGGSVDPGDLSPEQTAMREAHEEIGLVPRDVVVLGRLPDFVTVSHFWVTPIVACIPWPYHFSISPHEVSRVFTIPLSWLADPAHWEERPRMNRLGMSENVIYYQMYDGETLWGITGRITVELIQALSE